MPEMLHGPVLRCKGAVNRSRSRCAESMARLRPLTAGFTSYYAIATDPSFGSLVQFRLSLQPQAMQLQKAALSGVLLASLPHDAKGLPAVIACDDGQASESL